MRGGHGIVGRTVPLLGRGDAIFSVTVVDPLAVLPEVSDPPR
jgi:hypothetical protein